VTLKRTALAASNRSVSLEAKQPPPKGWPNEVSAKCAPSPRLEDAKRELKREDPLHSEPAGDSAMRTAVPRRRFAWAYWANLPARSDAKGI